MLASSWRVGEQLARVVEEARIGGEIGARLAADRFLIDAHETAHRVHDFGHAAASRRARAREQSVLLVVVLVFKDAPKVARDQLWQGLAHKA